MNKKFEKFLLTFVTIIITLTSIFPNFVLANVFTDYSEEELVDIYGDTNKVEIIKTKLAELIGYKIEKKIPLIIKENRITYSSNTELQESESISDIEKYLTNLFNYYCISKEGKNEAYGDSNDDRTNWDYSDLKSRNMAKELFNYMYDNCNSYRQDDDLDDYFNSLLYTYLTRKKQNEIITNVKDEYFPEKIEFNFDTFEAELSAWLDKELAKYSDDKDKAAYLLAFVREWFYRIKNRFDLSGTILDLNVPEDYACTDEEIKKIKLDKTSLEDFINKSVAKLEELNPGKVTTIVKFFYYDLFLHTMNVVLEKYPEEIDHETVEEEEIEELYEIPETEGDDTLDPISAEDAVWNMFSVTIDGIAGVLLWPARVLFIIVPGAVIQLVESLLAYVGSEKEFVWLSLNDIFFNNIPLIDIDIFNFHQAAGSAMSSGNVLLKIRENVSGWYYAIRNLCLALSFAVLVYIGIRMAISSIADDRAKYKKMLKDWVVSIALIFILHYFMIIIVTLNNGLINILNETRIKEETKLGVELYLEQDQHAQDIQDRVLHEALLEPRFSKGMGYSIVYLLLTAMTLLFLIVYIKRMIILCFLAIIAPLITVTYSMDKAGDGKAQAFGKWMSEFTFNILIQPFHCIIYMVFLQNIMYVITNTSGFLQIGKIVVAITILGFIYKAEDIIKSIFGFKTTSLSSAAVLGAAMIAKAQSAAKKVKGVKNAGQVAKGIKGVKTPNSLPSTAQKPSGPNAGPNTTASKTGSTAGAGTNKAAELAKKTVKGYWNVNKKSGKYIANHLLGSAVAYGMTGDAATAYSANQLVKSGKNRIDNARLKSAVRERKELTRDAYQDYSEHKGLNNKDDRLKEAKRLSEADINTLSDPAERNFAEWLQAEAEVHKTMGSKDPMKDVLKNLADYENGD